MKGLGSSHDIVCAVSSGRVETIPGSESKPRGCELGARVPLSLLALNQEETVGQYNIHARLIAGC